MIIDDEVNIAHFVGDFLEENGFVVGMVHTGREGLKAAMEQFPDVILLDVDLPDINGYAVCSAMRQKNALRNKPILMLTSLNDQQNELAGLKAGADDYLTKPINTSRLLARINTAIHRNIRELDANPLTHLPGNASIFQEIERRLKNNAAFSVIYADLNDFKAFNDVYGFFRGDQAIKLAAQCITFCVESHVKQGLSFVGHVGGDDFVAVVHADEAEAVCKDIIARFDSMIPQLYDEKDQQRGYIEGKSRQGQSVRYSFVSIALVIVNSTERKFQHPGEISSLSSELKTWAKSFGKSAYVTDRRKPQ